MTVENGRLNVALPFKHDVTLGDSLEQAKRRLRYLLNKLEIKPDLHKLYTEFISEFISMDHVETIPQDGIETSMGQNFYLPHRCIFKEASQTTKLRVIFDGSAKTSSGASINDALKVWPVVQDDLFSIILRFRFYNLAHSVDIAKMYRQVVLRIQYRYFHRFLWFDDDGNLKHYRFERLIYGTSCAAHLSTRCLKETAKRTEDPHISYALSQSFYVDDFPADLQTQ